jgi:predicted acyltransferase
VKQRYLSLDVFRGATVALMILVNNPGSWSHIFKPLEHAPWNGCTPTDLVFPFFLFAVGNAMAFVLPKWEMQGSAFVLKKIFRRSLLIFAIGLFLNWSPFIKWSGESLVPKLWVDPINPEIGIRILGVLQRIALCYLFASLIIHFFKTKGAFLASSVLLLGYWVIHLLQGQSDPYSLANWFGTGIDRSLLGVAHLYKGEGMPFDPEGLVSTLPAITQVIFGYFVGQYIQEKGKSYEMLANLMIAGFVLVLAGLAWDLEMPINKKIWTSSYVLFTSGLAMLLLGVFIYLLEFKEARGTWSKFFEVFGKNPLFIFVLSGFLPRVSALFRWFDHLDDKGQNIYTSSLPWFYEHICKPISSIPEVGSLVYALCIIAFMWSIVWFMDKKGWYVRV